MRATACKCEARVSSTLPLEAEDERDVCGVGVGTARPRGEDEAACSSTTVLQSRRIVV